MTDWNWKPEVKKCSVPVLCFSQVLDNSVRLPRLPIRRRGRSTLLTCWFTWRWIRTSKESNFAKSYIRRHRGSTVVHSALGRLPNPTTSSRPVHSPTTACSSQPLILPLLHKVFAAHQGEYNRQWLPSRMKSPEPT